jgi:troponin T
MSDEEDDHSAENEAELALKKRREAQQAPTGKGLNDSEKELLQSNKKEREKMDDEINELRKRNEKRKKEREVEEKRLTAERVAEDERRKVAEEDKKRKKEEEEEKKRRDRANKSEQFEQLRNPARPNFVISKKDGAGGQEEDEEGPHVPKKSKEQQDAEKKAILAQRIEKLSIDGFDTGKLSDKAKDLHKLIYRLEGEKYDYEKRFKGQQVDMMELAERARQANKVGRGGLKRVQVSSDDVDAVQAKYSGAPAKIMMYSKYERQKDKRAYKDRKVLYTGPIWGTAAARIKPQKIVKWSEEGLPSYEELPAETAAKEE